MPSGIPAPNVLGSLRFIASSGSDFFIGEYYVDDITYTEGYVGISELHSSIPAPLTVAPNPTATSALFSIDTSLQNAQLTLHDASGRVAWQVAWPAGSSHYRLPEGALAPGAYVATVRSGANTRYSGRLVVLP